MSYSFFVRTLKAPAFHDILRRINPTDLLVVNDHDVSKWPSATMMLCRQQRSTRGVYLSFADDQVEVKTNIFCAPEDYQLALDLTVAAAEVTGSDPRGEYTKPMPSKELLESHDSTWIKESHMSALRTTRALLRDRGPLGISGPFRTCYIGTHVLEQVGGADDTAAIEGILGLLRRVQWIHTAGYDAASEFTIGGTEQKLAIWFPVKRMFLPHVQWITIGDTEPLIVFPFERLVDVLGKPLTLIDECQPLIEPTSPQDFVNLVARARPFHTSPSKVTARTAAVAPSATPNLTASPPKQPKKPWWKVW